MRQDCAIISRKCKRTVKRMDDELRCYECTGYGDDYYIDDEGNLVRACDDCPFNGEDDEEDE